MTAKDKIRDHLANERTFLAWIRTSLGLIGLGFVLARMGLFLRPLAAAEGATVSRGLSTGQEFLYTGVLFLLIGTSFGVLSGLLYHHNRRAIDSERFEPSFWPVLVLTAVVVFGGVFVVALIVRHVLETGVSG